jgi:hypothetical protein
MRVLDTYGVHAPAASYRCAVAVTDGVVTAHHNATNRHARSRLSASR